MEKTEVLHAHIHDSASESGFSDLSALENETDDFGRRVLQHQRDQQRINNAVNGNLQPFRKARPTARLGQQLELKGVRDEIFAAREHERTGSGGSADSEPPLNVPREWGRKGRRRHDWLRNIHAPSEDGLQGAQGHELGERLDDGAIMPHRTEYTGDRDWTGLDHEPLPSSESDGTPPSMRRRRIPSSPTSLRHMNTTLNVLDKEEDGFSAASLLASTPTAGRRTRKIDELTRREIETVERRGVTKRTLGQIFEQSAQNVATASRPATAPSGGISRRRSLIVANKENLQPNGNSHSNSFKGSETVGLVSRTAQAVTFKNSQRPAHRREDSMNLLKQLARVSSSTSPSPAKGAEEMAVLKTRTRSEPALMDAGPLSAKSANSDYITGGRPLRDEVEEGKLSRQDVQPDSPERREQPVNAESDEKMSLNDQVDGETTPATHQLSSNRRTPLVTGAWIETPNTQTDVRPLLLTTDSTIVRAFGSPSGNAALERAENQVDDQMRRPVSEPAHAKSALSDILRDARMETQSQPEYGEATMMSLEDIVNPNFDSADPFDPTLTGDLDEFAQQSVEHKDIADERSITKAENDRRQERLAMEAMNKHLRAARTSIKDADRGLRRVENRMESAQPSFASLAPLTSSVQSTPNTTAKTTSSHPEGRHCEHCEHCPGGYHGSVWRALWMELLSCFYTMPSSSGKSTSPPPSRLPRLTWLGLLCALALTWFITETVLCEIHCMPRIASIMDDYGVDPDAPRFPFTIPTLLLWRPLERVLTLWDPSGAWREVLAAWAWEETSPVLLHPALIPMKVGSSVVESGTARWMGTASATVAAATRRSVGRVVGSVGEAAGEVGRMWEDEVLVG